jgi:hypothetical protein
MIPMSTEELQLFEERVHSIALEASALAERRFYAGEVYRAVAGFRLEIETTRAAADRVNAHAALVELELDATQAQRDQLTRDLAEARGRISALGELAERLVAAAAAPLEDGKEPALESPPCPEYSDEAMAACPEALVGAGECTQAATCRTTLTELGGPPRPPTPRLGFLRRILGRRLEASHA